MPLEQKHLKTIQQVFKYGNWRLALDKNISGNHNVAIGTSAIATSTITHNNVGVGNSVLAKNTGSDNTAIGNNSLAGWSGSATGSNKTSIGTYSSENMTSGNGNTTIGL